MRAYPKSPMLKRMQALKSVLCASFMELHLDSLRLDRRRLCIGI